MSQPTALRKAWLCILCITAITSATAQSLYEVPLDRKVQNSSLIIEGKVTGQKSFWNPAHTMIYTANTVEVYKVFKGSINKTEIEIMTVGGSVGDESVEASDMLSLKNDQVGVFFLHPNVLSLRSPQTNEVLMNVYASSQGFFKYSPVNGSVNAPFVHYGDIGNELYRELQQKTGRSFEDKKPSFKASSFAAPAGNQKVAAISGFTPTTVDAGALLNPATNLLTINGSGFGLPGGSAAVFFDDANDGTGNDFTGVAYNSPLMVSWTDAQIQVRVPTDAGTGQLIIRDQAGATQTAPGILEVRFSVMTAFFSSGTVAKESNLMNFNGSGGYTVLYSTNTANSGVNLDASLAKATFQRALATWKEVNGFNVTEGGTTTIQAVSAADLTNVIMFDNGGTGQAPLDDGVLGVCFSYNAMCNPAAPANQAQKRGFDIVIRNAGFSTGSTAFTLGPCPPMFSNSSEYDLETVLLHELGHALNLGHINDDLQGGTLGQLNPGKLMNYAIIYSVKRSSPDYSAKAGADYLIQPQGNTYGSCGLAPGEMVPLTQTLESKDECPATFPTSQVLGGTVVPFDLVHATSNKFVDPQYTAVNCAGTGTGVTNTAFYALRTDGNGGALSITVSGYSTTPAALTTCAGWTGVQLALYQVSSCPTGQAFPAPVACRTFTGDGPLSSITLAANTNYLLMVDGVENTKAAFSLTLAGSALPLNLSDFRGEVKKDHNLLNWIVELARDIKSVHVEHSADGLNWEKLGEVTGTIANRKGSYADYKPFIGNNYYRLAVVNLDNSKEYSKVVLLQRDDKLLVNVYPNPVRGMLYIDLNAETKGKYIIKLHNAIGQQVMTKEIVATSTNERVRLNTGTLANGTYHLTVFDDENIVVKSTQVMVK